MAITNFRCPKINRCIGIYAVEVVVHRTSRLLTGQHCIGVGTKPIAIIVRVIGIGTDCPLLIHHAVTIVVCSVAEFWGPRILRIVHGRTVRIVFNVPWLRITVQYHIIWVPETVSIRISKPIQSPNRVCAVHIAIAIVVHSITCFSCIGRNQGIDIVTISTNRRHSNFYGADIYYIGVIPVPIFIGIHKYGNEQSLIDFAVTVVVNLVTSLLRQGRHLCIGVITIARNVQIPFCKTPLNDVIYCPKSIAIGVAVPSPHNIFIDVAVTIIVDIVTNLWC